MNQQLQVSNNNGLAVIDQREVLGKDFKIYGDIENPLFLAKDVANWIEHTHITKMLSNIDVEEKMLCTISTHQNTYGGLRENTEMWFLTEDGLYEVLMQSRKPIAKQFKKKVKEILKSIRRTGSYTVQPKMLTATEQLELQLQVMKEQNKKIEQVNQKVDNLQDNMPLFNVECKELQALVRKTGIQMLGGYRSPAYRDNSLRGKVYADIQGQLKREFGVARYEAIKRCQLSIAEKILDNYKLPAVLEDEIVKVNNQISFNKEVV